MFQPQFSFSVRSHHHMPCLLLRERLLQRPGMWSDEKALRITSVSLWIFFAGTERRPFFFFFESESNFHSYRTETFSLNVLNRSNLHSQLSQRWCWVLDLEYNHNFLKFPYLGNPESYQPNIRKTYQSNWFLAMTEICKIREWSYTHAGKTKPLSVELVVTCRGAEYQNGGM